MEEYDVIVIGDAPMGLATATELSTSDKSTHLLEQYDFIDQKGSSAGLSRQFRIQNTQKYKAQMVLDSIPYWDALQMTTSDTLIDPVGRRSSEILI